MKNKRQINYILFIVTAVLFPWIYMDLSVFKINILKNIGYIFYSKVIIAMGFIPFLLILVLFLLKKSTNVKKVPLKRKVIKFPFILKAILISLSFFMPILFSIKLPFANIGYFQIEDNLMHYNDRALEGLKREGIKDIYWTIASNKGSRIYFNATMHKTQKRIESILKENGISFRKGR